MIYRNTESAQNIANCVANGDGILHVVHYGLRHEFIQGSSKPSRYSATTLIKAELAKRGIDATVFAVGVTRGEPSWLQSTMLSSSMDDKSVFLWTFGMCDFYRRLYVNEKVAQKIPELQNANFMIFNASSGKSFYQALGEHLEKIKLRELVLDRVERDIETPEGKHGLTYSDEEIDTKKSTMVRRKVEKCDSTGSSESKGIYKRHKGDGKSGSFRCV
jgi:hypothetical protein